MKKVGVFIVIGIIFLFVLIIGSLIKNYISKPSLPTQTSNGNYIVSEVESSTIIDEKNEIVKNNITVYANPSNIVAVSPLSWKFTVENLKFSENKFTWNEIAMPDFLYYEIAYYQNEELVIIKITEPYFDCSDIQINGEISIKPVIKNVNTQPIKRYINTQA